MYTPLNTMGANGQPFHNNSSMARRKWRYTAAALFCLLLIYLVGWRSSPADMVASLRTVRMSAVYNRTLGFQKVYAIGFPGRTDKRDAMTLASSFSEFDITWQNAVSFEDIPEKAIPDTFSAHAIDDSAIACWRAHLNVLSRIVDEKIETALIMEDDVDWDINVKPQLELLARGAMALQKPTTHPSPRNSPYGNSWDLLWTGHCYSGPHDTGEATDSQKMFFIKNDSTAAPVPFRTGHWADPHIFRELLQNDTRIVYESARGMCLWGYAITYEGARKVLNKLSLHGGNGRQVDVMLADMCEARELTSYAVWPALFASHRFAGYRFRDSDIKDKDKDEWHDEFTAGIVYPTMLNLPLLVSGSQVVASQYPNDTIPVRALEQRWVDEVRTEVRDINLPRMEEKELKGINIKGRFDMVGYMDAMDRLGVR